MRVPDTWTWVRFALWAVAGAVAAWVGLGLLGIPFGIAVVVVMVVLAATRRLSSSAFGLLSGIGALCLFVAWLNRLGPGTVETRTATSFSSETVMDPRPWLAAGLVLIAVSLAGFLVLSGRRRSRTSVE
jgi:hypothetical protein